MHIIFYLLEKNLGFIFLTELIAEVTFIKKYIDGSKA